MEKDNSTKLVTFPEIYRNLFKTESLSMDPLLLPWQHFVGRTLRKDRVLQNSDDVTVTSLVNQSQHNFVILLRIPSCTFVPNLSKIRFFIFPWQYIFETALVRIWVIQINNDVTVTLFPDQSSQNSELF